MIKYLIERGSDPNAKTFLGKSAAEIAVEQGRKEIVEFYFERGMDVKETEKLLLRAVEIGAIGFVRLILEKGVDANAEDVYGVGLENNDRQCIVQHVEDIQRLLKF
jgi:ankyrin repeat protein